MRSRFSHAIIDRVNAAQDRLIASRLRRDRQILRRARMNLRRWTARERNRVRPAFIQWGRILTCLSVNEFADFLVSDTPLARRLRQSSPFAGVLTESERRRIRKRHEKEGT
jgi:hypothetical protein